MVVRAASFLHAQRGELIFMYRSGTRTETSGVWDSYRMASLALAKTELGRTPCDLFDVDLALFDYHCVSTVNMSEDLGLM